MLSGVKRNESFFSEVAFIGSLADSFFFLHTEIVDLTDELFFFKE